MKKKVYCPDCCIRMKPEYDHDFEVMIWVCPECGRTHVEGEDE